MAKYVGIDLGEYEVKIVELDGSYKRPRLLGVHAARVLRAPDGKDVLGATQAKTTVRAFADAGVSKENVCLGFPVREAVLRSITVPFQGAEQIKKVIKFEVEGAIHSHQVDDMVVDFWPLAERKGETDVNVVAVPKAPLRTVLQTMEKGGLEPEKVDLDVMALYRAAVWCGAVGESGVLQKQAVKDKAAHDKAVRTAEAAGGDAPLAAGKVEKMPVRLIVDVGARATRVLITRDGLLVDLRAMRSGADAIADEVAVQAGVPLDVARTAVEECLRSGDDYVVVVESADAIAGKGGKVAEPVAEEPEAATSGAVATAAEPIPYKLVLQARDRLLDRLGKEFVRFLASVRNLGPIEAVFVTGGGSVLPGIDLVIEEAFGKKPEPLDVLAGLSHSLSEEEAKVLGPKIATALGLALKWLGGVPGVEFRQEDLAFTRRFDRIKFPLAIACMVGAFFMLVYLVKLYKDVDMLEGTYGATWVSQQQAKPGTRAPAPQVQFTGYLGKIVNPGSWFQRKFEGDGYAKLVKNLADTPVFRRLPALRRELDEFHKKKQKESGFYSEFAIESGYAVLAKASEVIEQELPKLGRFILSEVDLNIVAQSTGRSLLLTFALRSDSISTFRQKFDVLEKAFSAACKQDNSPFDKVTSQGSERPFRGDTDEGAYMSLKIELKSPIPVFHDNRSNPSPNN